VLRFAYVSLKYPLKSSSLSHTCIFADVPSVRSLRNLRSVQLCCCSPRSVCGDYVTCGSTMPCVSFPTVMVIPFIYSLLVAACCILVVTGYVTLLIGGYALLLLFALHSECSSLPRVTFVLSYSQVDRTASVLSRVHTCFLIRLAV